MCYRGPPQDNLFKARDKIRVETGRCEGPKHYGELPGEAEILKEVRYMRRRTKYDGRHGKTPQEIADYLNDKGIPTRQGKRWNPALVRNVIKHGKLKRIQWYPYRSKKW
jgi:hypothetical protein